MAEITKVVDKRGC